MQLDWPEENAVDPALAHNQWSHAGSNCCLDFHGDPCTAQLRVFSDGNHHMALAEALESFRIDENLACLFYCTTPPKVYLDWIKTGVIEIGNLRLSATPDIVIGPDDIMERLAARSVVRRIAVFAHSSGNSLLVARENPKDIRDIRDILREDVRLFLSNPVTENASHQVYRQTLEDAAEAAGLGAGIIAERIDSGKQIVFGDLIHHREAPQAVADDLADVAVVYDHLALRYTRIFPELFEQVPMARGPENVTTSYAIGLVDESNDVALAAFQHFLAEKTQSIYSHHGLRAHKQ